MTSINSKNQRIVIDASFWINIVYLEIEDYLKKYFEIYFVSKVEAEVLNNSNYKLYDSIDMEKYKDWKQNKIIIIKDPINIPKKLLDNLESNSGELYTIALAIEEKMVVCIDDGKPHNFCFNEGLFPVNSIDFIYFLYLKKEINSREYILLINKLAGRIKLEHIEKAKRLI